LYIACQNGHRKVVEYLISKGADIEARFKDGFTPIYIAAQKGHKNIVELLIQKVIGWMILFC
jgi:ankyrin repeat protein